jgi:hypothetical protein
MTRRVIENPFHVLGLPLGAGRAEIEGAGQKLLAMLELGLDGAGEYPTPLGPAKRTAEDVRRALAELRDPARRLEHELWAALPRAPSGTPRPAPPALEDARRRLGWMGSRRS